LKRFEKNEVIYDIPMNTRYFGTNNWMQHYDPMGSTQFRRGCEMGMSKRTRGLTLCYNCRRSGHLHLVKECSEVGPIFLFCKVVGHKVEDCPKIIAKVEGRNIIKESIEESQEAKGMLESHKDHRSEDVRAMLLQLEGIDDTYKDISLQ